MSEQRDQIVRRVVQALDETRNPDDLVRAYFDDDRAVVIEATRETLEATRERTSPEKVAAAVDRELIEALRLPAEPRPWSVRLYMNRAKVAAGSGLVVGAALGAWLLLFL